MLDEIPEGKDPLFIFVCREPNTASSLETEPNSCLWNECLRDV